MTFHHSDVVIAGWKRHLLTGASVAVISLAAGLAVPGAALAQTELDGTGITTDQAAGVVESDAVAGVTVAIDTNDADDGAADTSAVVFGGTNGNSILNSTDQVVTLNVTDSVGTTAVGYLVLDEAVNVTGGGTIAINLGGVVPAGIVFNGSVVETNGTITIQAGDGAAGVGDTFDLVFASDQNRDLTIEAAISAVGDDNIVLRVVDTEGTSGNSVTFTDAVNVGTDAGDLIVVDGNITEGATGGDDVGDYDVAAAAVTAVFQSDVTAGEIQLDSTDQAATLVLGASGATTTVTADIDSEAGANNTLIIADGANVTIVGDVLSNATWSAFTVGNGSATTLTLQGDTGANANLTLSDNATLVVDATGGNRTLDGDVLSDDPGSTTTFQVTGDGAGGNAVTLNGTVGAGGNVVDVIDLDDEATFTANVFAGAIDADADATFNGDLSANSLDVAATFTSTLGSASNAITGDITGAGSLEIGAGNTLTLGANGAMSTLSIADLGGVGAGNGNIAFAAGSMVTINSTIGSGGSNSIGNFTLDDANTTVTINSADAVAVTGGGQLVLGQGTTVLGSNIGDTDTVFAVAADNDGITNGTDAHTIQLSANIGNAGAETIILATTGGVLATDLDGNAANGEIVVTDTALTDFTIDDNGVNIEITSAARTTQDTANELGISSGEANALRQAVTSADTIGDTAGLDALTTALNAGGAQATQAAQQVGVQQDVQGGGSQVAFDSSSAQQSVTGNRLAGLRSDDPRFASAFASTQDERGFSGGDLVSAPYTPRYTNSVWLQAFGGVASADGDSVFAGYDGNFGGAMIGIDGQVSEDVVIGAFGSFTLSTVDGDGAGNAELDAETYTIGVYGSYTGQSFYVDGFASFALANNDSTRIGVGNETITADYDATQFAIGAAAGVPIEVSSGVFITPNASLTWNHYDADSYTETGSLGFSANVNPDSVSQLTGTLGARLHAVYEQGDGTAFIPEVSVAVVGDLIDDDAVSTATFVGGGTAYTVTGTDTDDIGALIGAGFSFESEGWSAGLSYDADLRSDYQSHTGRAEFRWKF